MIDAAAATRWLPSDLRPKLERLVETERLRQYREYIALLRSMIPLLHDAAALVESSWFELSDEDQKRALDIKLFFDEISRSTSEDFPKNWFYRIMRGFRNLPLLGVTEDRHHFDYGVMRFCMAVNQMIVEESRRHRFMSEKMRRDPASISAIEAGEKEIEAGQGRSYDRDAFLARFN